jgi:hypothetical protein
VEVLDEEILKGKKKKQKIDRVMALNTDIFLIIG